MGWIGPRELHQNFHAHVSPTPPGSASTSCDKCRAPFHPSPNVSITHFFHYKLKHEYFEKYLTIWPKAEQNFSVVTPLNIPSPLLHVMRMCLTNCRITALSQEIYNLDIFHSIELGKKSPHWLCSFPATLVYGEGGPFRDFTDSRRPYQLLTAKSCEVCQSMKFTDLHTQNQNTHF